MEAGCFLSVRSGASAALVYGAPHVTYAQPRNLVGGHIISAILGVFVSKYLGLPIEIGGPRAVATALIVVLCSPKIKALDFSFVLMPVATGALLMLIQVLASVTFT